MNVFTLATLASSARVYNNTIFAPEDIAQLPIIGLARSLWRQRDVTLFRHPRKTDCVISVGLTFDGAAVIMAEEKASDWIQAIGKTDSPYVYH